jgi:signal transduction histidine kinase
VSESPWLDRITHDLRGPLMPLQTAAYLLRSESDGNPRVRELADIVDRQSQRLARMLEELGDWSRACQQRLRVQSERSPLGMLLDLAVGAMPPTALQPDVDGDALDATVEGDPQRLVQMFAILLAHAQARDPERAPMVEARQAGGRIRVVVRDRGAAPEPAQRDQLLSAPQSTPYDDGLGLRLLVARAIAEAHGGRIEVDGAPGEGLALACELPLA